jgi:predicted Zn-dependent peptidase
MLTEGTIKKSAEEIADILAFHAAQFGSSVGSDFITFELTCLNKHLVEVLHLIGELFSEAVFPEKEFEILVQKNVQMHRVNLEKVNFLALAKFREKIFGMKHPYGFWVQNAELFRQVKREELSGFYNSHIKEAQLDIFIAGRFDERAVSALNNVFGKFSPRGCAEPNLPVLTDFVAEKVYIEKENANQTCIRLGIPAVSPKHEDYFPFLMLNEILGGYFGSRLMKNIREEKGLTYGIYSNLSVLRRFSLFSVQAEVNKDMKDVALEEILKEIRHLTIEKVPEEELRIVKNSVTGGFISSVCTPFEVMDKIRTRILNDFPDDFYENFIENISKVSSDDIFRVAERYFSKNMLVVMAG